MLATTGKPIPNALIDFWQADARGAYDNSGYRFRGHQFTNAKGQYYAPDRRTRPLSRPHEAHPREGAGAARAGPDETQLFFPSIAGNRSDGIYTSECLVKRWRLVNGRRVAAFDFVLDV